MRALRIGPDRGVGVTEVGLAEPGPGQVVLRVLAAGICHSDVHVVAGDVGADWPRPFTLGHETAGLVTAVGPGVDEALVGGRFAVYSPTGCRTCATCHAGAWNYCDRRFELTEAGLGLGGDGGIAEAMVLDARRLVPSGDLAPAVAALLTDAGLTSFHAVSLIGPHHGPAPVIVVVGIGGLGHLALQLLRAQRVDARLVGVDPKPGARDLARQSGADHAVPPDEVAALVDDLTRGEGARAVLDFVGTTATMTAAASRLGTRGDLVVVGSGGGSITLDKRSPELARGIGIRFPVWGSHPELAEVIELGQRGVLRPTYDTISLDEAPAGLTRLRDGAVAGRLVVTPGSDA